MAIGFPSYSLSTWPKASLLTGSREFYRTVCFPGNTSTGMSMQSRFHRNPALRCLGKSVNEGICVTEVEPFAQLCMDLHHDAILAFHDDLGRLGCVDGGA